MFLKRLQAELPTWVQQGWVAPEHQQSILRHVGREAHSSPRYLIVVLSVMGALLFGAGVISFLAANWGLIPKVVKLAVLFGALAASYAGAALCRARDLDGLAQGLLLLGVLLFGANIFLIAQIYHIDAHYPDGVLVWALGALLTAALMRSQPALIATLALAALWSTIETFDFNRNPYWPFLLLWAATLVPIYFYRSVGALRVACWVLFAWFAASLLAPQFLNRPWIAGERVALLQIYVFAGIAFYIVARGMSWYSRWAPFAAPIVTHGAVLSVVALYLLSFPALQRFDESALFSAVLPAAWISATVGVLVLVALLMVWRYRDTQLSTLPLYRQGAFLWLAFAGAMAIGNLLLAGRYPGWVAAGYNLLGLTGVIWLVLTGAERGERRIINLGFAFFAALLLARYFDTFWSLLDRSYFFMLGGALLLVIGLFLERSRRKLTARLRMPGAAA